LIFGAHHRRARKDDKRHEVFVGEEQTDTKT